VGCFLVEGGEFLKVGSVWWIDHNRKGSFVGRVVEDHGEFVDVEILQGNVHYLSVAHKSAQVIDGLGQVGSVISIRKSLAVFTPAKQMKAGNWVAEH